MQAQKPARIVLDAGVMPEIARTPRHERVAPTSPEVGELRGAMCLSCARIYRSCCF